MHSIETTIVLFVSFVCIVLLLQTTLFLHNTVKESSEAAYRIELDSHRLGKNKEIYKAEFYTRLFSVVEDLLRKKERDSDGTASS